MAVADPGNHYVLSSYDVPYSSHSSLNTLDIHRPAHVVSGNFPVSYWVIYIHGGAWRDPQVTSKAILPTLPHLNPYELGIAGVASINYRLSPYPSHQTAPSSPNDEGRNVRHPAHIEDVLTAITFLSRSFGFGADYIIVGHSCGATLALQAAMGEWLPRPADLSFELPVAIVGIEGIYDLKLLVDTHSHPIYREFVEGAFGPEEGWKEASPITGKYSRSWVNGRVVVLAHSDDDELVDWNQTERMSDRLWREKRSGKRDVVIKVKGKHDEIWEDGKEVARTVEVALGMLRGVREPDHGPN